MAEAIADGLVKGGVGCKLIKAAVTDRNDALVDIFEARTIVVGCPTFNNGLLPSLTPLLEDLKGLRFQNKIGAAFGSYGWSGQSVKLLEEHLAASGISVVREGLRCKWQPRPEDLQACRDFGSELAEATKNA